MTSRCIYLALIFIASHAVAQDTTKLSLLFVGDIMQHDSNIAAAYNPITGKYDYTRCFEYVAPIIGSADIAIGNLELTLGGKPYKGYPQFSAPDELAVELKKIGFDVLVTANNHSVDRGKKGIERTLRKLDSIGMMHTGTFADTTDRKINYPLLLEKNGIRLALLNYTYGTNGIPVPRVGMVNLMDTIQIKKDIRKAKQLNSDAIIVFMHWGDEYQSLPNNTQKKLTSLCFREGVKIVIGSHPHVLQPMEWKKESDQFVAYSLGNFISGQRPRYRDGGAIVWLHLQKIKTDSLAVATIQDASYELEWVQKTADEKKEFVMLPMRYFDNDSTFIEDTASKEAIKLFKTDSRALMAKYNVSVGEFSHLNNQPFTYSIYLGDLADGFGNEQLQHDYLKMLELDRVTRSDSGEVGYLGKFHDKKSALIVLKQLQSDDRFKQARVVKRIDVGL